MLFWCINYFDWTYDFSWAEVGATPSGSVCGATVEAAPTNTVTEFCGGVFGVHDGDAVAAGDGVWEGEGLADGVEGGDIGHGEVVVVAVRGLVAAGLEGGVVRVVAGVAGRGVVHVVVEARGLVDGRVLVVVVHGLVHAPVWRRSAGGRGRHRRAVERRHGRRRRVGYGCDRRRGRAAMEIVVVPTVTAKSSVFVSYRPVTHTWKTWDMAQHGEA